MNALVNPKTEERLRLVTVELPQSLLLTGVSGVGLGTIAKELAGNSISGLIEPETAKGEIEHQTGTIPVDVIRRLYEQTRSKQSSMRVVVIDDADRMSHGAQGAFLKLLEEPNQSTHFILTSHAPQLLLPTIRSRVQSLIIDPITPEQTVSFLSSLIMTDQKKRTQLDYLAGGLPAELTRLVRDEAYFTTRAGMMGDARDFLTGDTYKRLLIIQKYYQDRSRSLQLIDSAMMMTRRSLSQKPQSALVHRLGSLLETRNKIAANHNIRLQLLAFAF